MKTMQLFSFITFLSLCQLVKGTVTPTIHYLRAVMMHVPTTITAKEPGQPGCDPDLRKLAAVNRPVHYTAGLPQANPRQDNDREFPLFLNRFFNRNAVLSIRTLTATTDTLPRPATALNGNPDVKVAISNGIEGVEFTPLSSLNNGVLIEPINRITNKGIPTAFYLSDSADWSFYTDAQQRLIINGDGKIVANSSLLINNKGGDDYALRVAGKARFDDAIALNDPTGNNVYISMESNVRYAGTEPDDGISPYTLTPVSWANGNNIPVFRIRHPLSVVEGLDGVNTSLQKDFMILPYQYGTAIEYNGVVECWVGEWSIHRGLSYTDVERKGNGWGGVLWIGDDGDRGGVRATARNNSAEGGNVVYGELSVEKFGGEPNGDFRLRLPSRQNGFHFVYGERGSDNVIAKMTSEGLVIPKVSSLDVVRTPERAQILFDSTDNQLKAFDGNKWASLTSDGTRTGLATTSGNGQDNFFLIEHEQGTVPSYFNVLAVSPGAANISYVTADDTFLKVHYTTPPPQGFNNLSWNWQVKK